MEFLKHLKNGTILIVPERQKSLILEEIDTLDYLCDIKIMSLSEFKKKYYFDYGKEALIYLTKKYDLKVSVAKIYLENMYSLSGLYTSSNLLNELTLMKNNLLSHNLLKTDSLFLASLSSHPIVFYGYDYYKKEEERLIEELKERTDVQVFRPVENPTKTLTVYEFSTIDSEVEYVLKEIAKLLHRGVSCNQIKLAGVFSEYQEPVLRIAKFYQIPIALSNPISVFETLVGKKTIAYLEEGYDFYDILSFLDKEFPNSEVLQLLLQIFNRYAFFEEEKTGILDLLIDDMKHTYLKPVKRQEEIEVISLDNSFLDSSFYVFVLGFNNGNFPMIRKDEDFISDVLKKELGLTTSEEWNQMERDALMRRLWGIPNLVITYKLKTYFEEYYPSTLIEDYHMEKQRISDEELIHYSKKYDALKLTMLLDNYIRYGKKDPFLEQYYTTLKIPYLTYDHSYQKIELSDLYRHLEHKLLLSYSAIDRFYHCKFRYYLQDILKISHYEDTLSIKIGNVFHAVLARAFLEDFDFEREFTKECERYELTKKEQFYFQKLKTELAFIIQTIREQNEKLGFQEAFYEEKIYLSKEGKIPVTFMGIVDKILRRRKEGVDLTAIIDYKTGSTDLDLRMVPHGLNLQLPVYMYLIARSPKFKGSQICGIYLQKILNSPPNNSQDFLQDKKEALKLRGYSIDDESLLEIWDSTYENSEVIKSLKKTKTGWYHYAKLLSAAEEQRLISLVEEKIDAASQDILNADFTIDPKRIEGKNIGCEFCKFQDICFSKEQDIVSLEEYKDLSFLQESGEREVG